jgi:hypothetical protein
VTQQPGSELADVDPSADLSISPAAAQDQGGSTQVQAAADGCEEPTEMALITIVLTPDRHTAKTEPTRDRHTPHPYMY